MTIDTGKRKKGECEGPMIANTGGTNITLTDLQTNIGN